MGQSYFNKKDGIYYLHPKTKKIAEWHIKAYPDYVRTVTEFEKSELDIVSSYQSNSVNKIARFEKNVIDYQVTKNIADTIIRIFENDLNKKLLKDLAKFVWGDNEDKKSIQNIDLVKEEYQKWLFYFAEEYCIPKIK